jgi:hypothetical protein
MRPMHGGRGGGRGQGDRPESERRPSGGPSGISRTQRQLLTGLDRLRGTPEDEEEPGRDSDDEDQPPPRRARWQQQTPGRGAATVGGRGARGALGSAATAAPAAPRPPRVRAPAPEEFSIVKSPRSSSWKASEATKPEQLSPEQDGSRFWREVSGFDDEVEDDDEDEDGEEGEDEDESECELLRLGVSPRLISPPFWHGVCKPFFLFLCLGPGHFSLSTRVCPGLCSGRGGRG